MFGVSAGNTSWQQSLVVVADRQKQPKLEPRLQSKEWAARREAEEELQHSNDRGLHIEAACTSALWDGADALLTEQHEPLIWHRNVPISGPLQFSCVCVCALTL